MKNILLIVLISFSISACKKDKTCPDHFSGSNCDVQETPTNIFLKSVTVTDYSETDAGAGWDISSGPDIYLSIVHDGVEIYNNSASFIQNSVGSKTFTVNLALPSVSDFYTIRLLDYDDFDADDFMGGIQNVFYFSSDGFPSNVTFECPGCPVAFTCSIAHTF